jgi:FdhD protein
MPYHRAVDPVERVRVHAREGDTTVERTDSLAVEEPLEIRVRSSNGSPAVTFVTTMRTPGHDEELAAGLLFAEGVLEQRDDLLALDHPTDPRVDPDLRANVILATLSDAALARAQKLVRGTVMGSACGVCGRTSIERVLPEGSRPIDTRLSIDTEVLFGMPDLLKQSQSVFAQTGGLHAAGLFTSSGVLRAVREDIGRHNATDKLVGSRWLTSEIPLSENVLLVSGRTGFEIVQKAHSARIPIVASVSAPSSLAVELADAGGITLVGFLRGRRFNVYSHTQRIVGA